MVNLVNSLPNGGDVGAAPTQTSESPNFQEIVNVQILVQLGLRVDEDG